MNREVYLAARTDGMAGSGTATDPYDVSTATKLDNFFNTQFGTVFNASWVAGNTEVTLSGTSTTANLQVGEFIGHRYGWLGGSPNGSNYIASIIDSTHFILAIAPIYTASNDSFNCSIVSASAAGCGIAGGTGYDGAIFRFAPGSYTTVNGIQIISGWKLVGCGEGTTILTSSPAVGRSNTMFDSATYAAIYTVPTTDCIDNAIRDMTIDGGVLNIASTVQAAFTIPSAGGTSSPVPVNNVANLTVGQAVYVQDLAFNAANYKQYYGQMTVTAISGNNVTLANNINSPSYANFNVVGGGGYAVPGMTTNTVALIPATSSFGIYVSTGGNLLIENVNIQNVALPFYEGVAGIQILTQSNSYTSKNNIVRRVYLSNYFGTAAIGFWFQGGGNGSPTNGLQISCTECTIAGNGYYQGVSFGGSINSTLSNCKISNVEVCFYNDTGYNVNPTFVDNVLSTSSAPYALGGIYFGGSGTANSPTGGVFSGNHITLGSNSQNAIKMYSASPGIAAANNSVTNNTILGAAGVTTGTGITINSSLQGTTGNSASDNTIQTGFTNPGSLSSGTQADNRTTANLECDLGLTEVVGSPYIVNVSQSRGPITSLGAAQSLAESLLLAGAPSVTIFVWDGTFNEKNLGYNNVNWVFYPSASIVITGASNADTIFTAGSGVAYNVFGFGQTFSITSTTGGVHAIYLNGGGTLNISDLTFKVTGASTTSSGANTTTGIFLYTSTSAMSLNCNSVHLSVSDTSSSGGAYGIYNGNPSNQTTTVIGSGNITVAGSSAGAVGLYSDMGAAYGASVNWTGTANLSVTASGQYLISARYGTTSLTWNGPINVLTGTFSSIIYINASAVSLTFNGPINYSSSGALCSTRASGSTLIFGAPVRLYGSAMVAGVVTVTSGAIDTGKLVNPVHRGTTLTNAGVLGITALSAGSARARSTNTSDTDVVDFLLMT